MKLPIKLGVDLNDPGRKTVVLPEEKLRRHLHCIGATGAGKTVSIHAVLRPILKQTGRDAACVFVIDPMGNLSRDLLMWIASPYCPDHVRRRLIYIEPARSEYVIPFNPLRMVNDENLYYHTARAVDLVMRAWSAQNLAEQPRLMRWSYNAMAAMAALRLPLVMSRYLLHPGSDEHDAILELIPDETRGHWKRLLYDGRGNAETVLDSTRNRFQPFYKSPQVRRMFGTFDSRFDTERFIRERRIVILNVAGLGKMTGLLSSTIGSLVANEVFETTFNLATTLGRQAVEPTYLLLDECQKFVSPDVEDALPTCRQMGLRLILAHQSFSQLQRGDIDMSNIIWQARNRLMFANSAEDADIIAEELATLTFDPMAIKDRRTSLKQLIAGYRIEWLESEGITETHADSTVDQRSVGYSRGKNESHRLGADGMVLGDQSGQTHGTTTGGTHADSHSTSRSRSQHLVPIHEQFEEVSNVTFRSFDDHRQEWRRIVRQLRTGEAFGQFDSDPQLHHLQIDHRPVRETRSLETRYQELLQKNFEQEFFISTAEAERLAEQDRLRLLAHEAIQLPPGTVIESAVASSSGENSSSPPATSPLLRHTRNS